MSNIYFPDEQITFNDLYFVCYMIEKTARQLKQPNLYVVKTMGKPALERQLSIAETNHCLNPQQVSEEWINEYHLTTGTYDVSAVNPNLTDKIPTALQMGKVYARLTASITTDDGNLAESILRVYASPICKYIDNYDTGAYYEPSYIQTRAYYNGGF